MIRFVIFRYSNLSTYGSRFINLAGAERIDTPVHAAIPPCVASSRPTGRVRKKAFLRMEQSGVNHLAFLHGNGPQPTRNRRLMKPSLQTVSFCTAGDIIGARRADASLFGLPLRVTKQSRVSLCSYYRATGARNARRVSVKAHSCNELLPVGDHFDGRDCAMGDEADDEQQEKPAHGQRKQGPEVFDRLCGRRA